MTNIPIENAGYKDIDGMCLQWTGLRTLKVTSGQARGTGNTNDILFDQDKTLNIDVNGIGGIDGSGLSADSFYYVFAIGDSTKNLPSAVIASISLVPILNQYDVYRMIGGFKTVSGSADIQAFTQTGMSRERWITYESPVQVLSAGNATAWTLIATQGSIPSQNGMASVISALTPSVAANRVMLRNSGSAGSGSSLLSGDVAGVVSWRETLTPFAGGTFEYQVDAAGDSVDLYIKAYLHSL